MHRDLIMKHYIIKIREPLWYYSGRGKKTFISNNAVGFTTKIEDAKSFDELKDAEIETKILSDNYGYKNELGIIKK